jgi:hypothetical protein
LELKNNCLVLSRYSQLVSPLFVNLALLPVQLMHIDNTRMADDRLIYFCQRIHLNNASELVLMLTWERVHVNKSFDRLNLLCFQIAVYVQVNTLVLFEHFIFGLLQVAYVTQLRHSLLNKVQVDAFVLVI